MRELICTKSMGSSALGISSTGSCLYETYPRRVSPVNNMLMSIFLLIINFILLLYKHAFYPVQNIIHTGNNHQSQEGRSDQSANNGQCHRRPQGSTFAKTESQRQKSQYGGH